MSLREENRQKLYELQPHCHWAAGKWLDECFNNDLEFKISEVYRSQERQNKLYAQGRWELGNIVTWTLRSQHTKRLAVDIYPINCTHAEIEEIAEKYGITHPFPLDPPHYEFNKAHTYKPTYSSEARIKRYTLGKARAIRRGLDEVAAMFQRIIDRIKKRGG